jgi:hypothetical protein
LGTSWPVFIGLTGVLMGFISFMTGRALAQTWRPAHQVVIYGLLLGLADRFLTYALFGGQLLSFVGYLVHSGWIVAVGLFAYGLFRADRMVRQYPWLYERSGIFSVSEIQAPVVRIGED